MAMMLSLGVLIGIARMLMHTAAFGLFLSVYQASDLTLVYVAIAVVGVAVLLVRRHRREAYLAKFR